MLSPAVRAPGQLTGSGEAPGGASACPFGCFDTFSRADGPLGWLESGQPWRNDGGSWGVVSGQLAKLSAGSFDAVSADSCLVDADLTVTVSGTFGASPFDIPTVAWRLDTDVNGGNYLALNSPQGVAGQWELRKIIAGGFTSLGTAAGPTPNGTPIAVRVLCQGTRVRCYTDGVLRFDHTLTGPDAATLTRPGQTRVSFFNARVGSPAFPSRWDSLSVVAG